MTGPLGNSEFCFPRISMLNIEILGKIRRESVANARKYRTSKLVIFFLRLPLDIACSVHSVLVKSLLANFFKDIVQSKCQKLSPEIYLVEFYYSTNKNAII